MFCLAQQLQRCRRNLTLAPCCAWAAPANRLGTLKTKLFCQASFPFVTREAANRELFAYTLPSATSHQSKLSEKTLKSGVYEIAGRSLKEAIFRLSELGRQNPPWLQSDAYECSRISIAGYAVAPASTVSTVPVTLRALSSSR